MHRDDTAPAGPKQRFRFGQRVAAVAIAIAGVVFVVVNRHDLPAVATALRHASVTWLVVGLLGSAALMVTYGELRSAALRAFGIHVPFGVALRASTIAHLLNIVTKSGGMAGVVIYRRLAERRGHSAGVATGAYLVAVVLGDLAFAATLIAAFGLLIARGRLTVVDVIAAIAFAVYAAVLAAVLVAAARSRATLRRVYALPTRVAARLLPRRTGPADAVAPGRATHEGADELFDAVALARTRLRAIAEPLLWALAVEAAGVCILWASLRAFGVHTGIGLPLVGYAVSVLFSIVGFLPAGLGFAEASLGAVLVSFGVSGPTAALVVITERFLEAWLPLAVGALASVRWRP